jgi:hypothetical protein
MEIRAITPLPADYTPGNALRELETNEGIGMEITLEGEFSDLMDSGIQNWEHREIVLDWAMQIRQNEKLEWAECIRAASIFFFG